jgi:hypothetical protein
MVEMTGSDQRFDRVGNDGPKEPCFQANGICVRAERMSDGLEIAIRAVLTDFQRISSKVH